MYCYNGSTWTTTDQPPGPASTRNATSGEIGNAFIATGFTGGSTPTSATYQYISGPGTPGTPGTYSIVTGSINLI